MVSICVATGGICVRSLHAAPIKAPQKKANPGVTHGGPDIANWLYVMRTRLPFRFLCLPLVLAPLVAADDWARLQDAYSKLPIAFEPNRGRAGAETRFLARSADSTLLLRDTGAIIPSGIMMKFAGASPAPAIHGLHPLPGRSNYFVGSDPRGWRIQIRQYARVR
jgi:hypothetical protein